MTKRTRTARIRLPDGSTTTAEVGPDVDLKTEEVYDRRGNRIDDAYVRGAVDELHCQLGRPSLSHRTGISPRVSFRLSDELRERAEARAAADGTSVSKLARKALEEYLQAS